MWVLVGVFVASIFFGAISTGMLFQATGPSGRAYQSEQEKVVLATVGTERLQQGYVDDIFKEMVSQQTQDGGRGVNGPAEYLSIRSGAYNEAVKDLYVQIGLQRLGVRAGDGDITRIARESVLSTYLNIEKQSAEQAKSTVDEAARVTKENEGKAADKQEKVPEVKTAAQILDEQMRGIVAKYSPARVKSETQKVTKDQFVNWMAEDFFVKKRGLSFARQARVQLLGEAVAKKVLAQMGKPATDPLSEQYIEKLKTKEVEASWIFIASRKPEPEKKPENTLFGAKAEADKTLAGLQKASERAAKLRKDIILTNTAEAFATKATESSNDDTSKAKGGSLGWVKSEAQQAFSMSGETPVMVEYLAFTQNPGEMSQPELVAKSNGFSFTAPPLEVGYALVKVDNIRDRDYSAMPEASRPNWARDKQSLILEARQDYSRRLGEAYVEKLKYEVPVMARQPEAKLALAQEEAKPETDLEVLRREMYAMINTVPEVRAALAHKLAQTEKDPAVKADLLEEALAAAGNTRATIYAESANALVALADTRKADDDKKIDLERAAERLNEAAIGAKQPMTMNDAFSQMQASGSFDMQRLQQMVDQSKESAITERKDILIALQNVKRGFDAIPGVKSDALPELEANTVKVTQWLKDNPAPVKEPATPPAATPAPKPKPAATTKPKARRR
jgi:hypothetical protein